jgi:hypothetical protein
VRSNDRFLVLGTVIVLVVLLPVVVETSWTQTPGPLGTVKTIQIDPTVVPNPDKVKESFAANSVRDILQDAFSRTLFEIGPSTVHAHIVLDEFSKGSQAKRTLVGLGAGRSTITAHLVIQSDNGRELVNVRIHVRGNLAFSPYQGGNTQTKQATSSFEQKLVEEIEKLK